MRSIKVAVMRMPYIGAVLLAIYRLGAAFNYFSEQFALMIRWLFKSRETTNYTYDLKEHNLRYMVSMISDILAIDYDVVAGYINEIEDDEVLKQHITYATSKSEWAFMADKEIRFGKRMGWYAFVRAMKPGVVVETGVDKGLGSCVLTSALKRNNEEGYTGRYYGTDINPKAGYLLSGKYAEYGKILYGDSIESLKQLDSKIDLFINDSDHSAEYEAREYDAITDKLSDNAIILGDNSHCTDKLLNYSLNANRHFIFFQEMPLDHWYPGAGIGVSFRRK